MLSLLAASATALLTIQWGKTDITPQEPLPLGGYTERGSKLSEAGGEHLFARSVLLTQAKAKIAVVSAEMLTIPESLYREVRKRVPADVQLFICATHTHSAPDSQMLNERMTLNVPGIANFRPSWLEWYAEKIAQSVITAARSRGFICQELAIQRTALPLNRGRREGAQPDQTATSIWAKCIDYLDRRRVTVIDPLWFHYSAHAVFQGAENLKLSGDWPGRVARSGHAVLQGAIGDVSPSAPGVNAAARIASFELATREVMTYGTMSRQGIDATPLKWSAAPIKLAPPTAHPEFARLNRIPDSIAQSLVSRFAPPAASISALRIGKLVIVGVPGEPTSELGRAIVAEGRKRGFFPVLVVSHVNGWMGYILAAEDYDRGGYEATLSFYGREEGARVVEAASRALNKLK